MKMDSQTVGNVGLHYVCYKLSRMGWNAMPTTRNARGIDVLIYSQDAQRKLSIQVKTLSRRSPVPMGRKLDNLYADYVVICRYQRDGTDDVPECFVLVPGEVRDLVHTSPGGDHWLQQRSYEDERFHEAWERIGSGL